MDIKDFKPGVFYRGREIAQIKNISIPGKKPQVRLIPREPQFPGEEIVPEPGEPLLQICNDIDES